MRLSTDFVFESRRPALRDDAFAGEVNDGIDARDLGGIDRPGRGIPADFVLRRVWRATNDRPHEVAVGFERRR